jgi:hypothetical protein
VIVGVPVADGEREGTHTNALATAALRWAKRASGTLELALGVAQPL